MKMAAVDLSRGVWLSVGLLSSALVTQTILFVLTFGIKVPWYARPHHIRRFRLFS